MQMINGILLVRWNVLFVAALLIIKECNVGGASAQQSASLRGASRFESKTK
jgi:hypothetical protein